MMCCTFTYLEIRMPVNAATATTFPRLWDIIMDFEGTPQFQ